jgi:branched-chain amino acid transport system permease protein
VIEELLRIFTLADLLDVTVILIVVLALNLMAGYAGIPNFGMALFVFIGAFSLAGIGTRVALLLTSIVDPGFIDRLSRAHLLIAKTYNGSFKDILLYGVAGDPMVNRVAAPEMEEIISQDLILSMILLVTVLGAAIILGALMGIIASFAAVRLKEDYLAIVLLAFSEMMVMVIFAQTDFLVGGPNGAYVVKPWPTVLEGAVKPITPPGISSDLMIALIVSLLVLLLTFVYAERIANSPMGRVLRAMRDDDLVIATFGRDVPLTRLKVMAVGAMIASIAGVLYATIRTPVVASTYDRFTWTFVPWAMMILGGMANNWGVVLGAITIYVGQRLIYYYTPSVFQAMVPILDVISRLAVPLILSSTALIIILLALRWRAKTGLVRRLATYTIIGLTGFMGSTLILAVSIHHIISNIVYVQALLPKIFLGMVIILVLYLRPQGIIPEKPARTLSRRELKEILAGRSR